MNPDDFKGNRGGPAFPLPLGTGNLSEPSESGGMSLRDYFAAKVMVFAMDSANGPHWRREGARLAYEMADAMLAAREAA